MEFEHEGHWALYQSVRQCLEEEFDEEDVSPIGDEPAFGVEIGEFPLVVSVQAAGPKTCLSIVGRVESVVDITPEIARFLLSANFGHDVPFGAFGLNDEGAISFSHVVMGEGFEPNSLSLLLHLLSSKLDDVNSTLVGPGA